MRQLPNSQITPANIDATYNGGTLTLNGKRYRTFTVTLNASISEIEIQDPVYGAEYHFVFIQNGVGGHTVTYPSAYINATQPNDQPNSVSVVSFKYVGNSIFYAILGASQNGQSGGGTLSFGSWEFRTASPPALLGQWKEDSGELFINKTNKDNQNFAVRLLDVSDGSWLKFKSINGDEYQYRVSAATDDTNQVKYTIDASQKNGTINDSDNTELTVELASAAGLSSLTQGRFLYGGAGDIPTEITPEEVKDILNILSAGVLDTWSFSTTTTAGAAAGTFRLNNATPSSATKLYIADAAVSTVNWVSKLEEIPNGSWIYFQVDEVNRFLVKVSGYTAETGYSDFDIDKIIVQGTIPDATGCSVKVDIVGAEADLSNYRSKDDFLYEIFYPQILGAAILLEFDSEITSIVLSSSINTISYSDDNDVYDEIDLQADLPLQLSAGRWFFRPDSGGNIIIKGNKV